MAYTVREMSEEQISSMLMRNTAKLAMAELSANKVRSNFETIVVFLLLAPLLSQNRSGLFLVYIHIVSRSMNGYI